MSTRNKTLLIAFLGAVVLSILFFSLLRSIDSDLVQQQFSSYSEAIEKDALVQGMIPDFLPVSATEIVAERNLDLDTLTVEFAFGRDFEAFLSNQKTNNTPLPTEVLKGTSLRDVDIDQLQFFSNPGSAKECASHLMVDMKAQRAVYVYNVLPHRIGCWEKEM